MTSNIIHKWVQTLIQISIHTSPISFSHWPWTLCRLSPHPKYTKGAWTKSTPESNLLQVAYYFKAFILDEWEACSYTIITFLSLSLRMWRGGVLLFPNLYVEYLDINSWPGLDHIFSRLGPALPLPSLLHSPVFQPAHAWEPFLVGNQCDDTWS